MAAPKPYFVSLTLGSVPAKPQFWSLLVPVQASCNPWAIEDGFLNFILLQPSWEKDVLLRLEDTGD